ncbi:protein bric-a-brac 1-like isoform X2 [Phlebotomus papatasi]|uniref:protein bric-a-brac 1-like isoform X2 n=1 Tax=Phlebotomus papatasi TaxID=29031 RepID=UPI0024846B0C|nr:protein bric-a-brac 1-like isoform X2 [Phlebotomus papatasi]
MDSTWSMMPQPMSTDQYFSIRWNNYQRNMTAIFHELLESQSFVDVTLACEQNSLKAHKVVLSACSQYFRKLLLDNPCDHPTIIMPQDIEFSDLNFIIKFVYQGEINVTESELQSLLRTAEKLKIRCLCEEVTESGEGRSCDRNSGRIPPTTTKRTKNNQKVSCGERTSVTGSTESIRRRLSSRGDPDVENGAVVVLEPRQVLARDQKTMTSLGMGMGINGGLMGVSMGFLDFAPEPPAPSATPVTEHVDLNCTPSSDTRDLSIQEFVTPERHPEPLSSYSSYHSTPNGEVRIKLETLRSMDPSETLEMENHHIHTIHQLEHPQTHHQASHHPHAQQQQQQQQQHSQTQQVQQSHSPPPLPQQAHLQSQAAQQQVQQATQQQQQQQSRGNQQQNPHQSPVQTQQQQQPQTQPPTPQPQRHPNASPSDSHLHEQPDIKPSVHHSIVSASTSMDVDQSGMEHESMHGIIVTPEIVTMMTPSQMDMYNSDASEDSKMMSNGSPSNSNSGTQYTNLTPQHENRTPGGPKTWTQEDMEAALDALRNHNMSLTKASVTFGIPSTTLWQRAHRLGIDTPKKEGPTKSWSEDSLNNALEALRTGTISANKASKAFGIPSSTLYKIARREGIRLAAPFNAAPTTWTPEDLERALEAIRAGHASVQKASTEFGIPTGTLYGRCKREGIELSRSNPTPWSEDAMMEALEAVRVGQMSINQAAIHYNLPYSSLYGRFKRGKYDTSSDGGGQMDHSPENTQHHQLQYTTTVMQQAPQQQHPVHMHHHPPPQMVAVATSQPPPPPTPHPQPVQAPHHPPTTSNPTQNHPNSHVYHHHSQQHHHMERS